LKSADIGELDGVRTRCFAPALRGSTPNEDRHMPSCATPEEPPERVARPSGRAVIETSLTLSPTEVRAVLEGWLRDAGVIATRPISQKTRLRLEDLRRLAEELGRVLAGLEDGEGTAEERTLHAATSGGRIQALAALIPCPRAVFVEYLVAAPWNLLVRGEATDLRAVRGAGTALIEEARAWSWRRGSGGRIALQAENPRCLVFYERLGFERIRPEHDPRSLVARGKEGWSASVERLARGAATADDAVSPWLVLDARAVGKALAS
jgi:GNAT superfamily N-acetyltransferase